MHLPIYIATCDKTANILPALGYCMNRFWPGNSVHILGNTFPKAYLPENFHFHNIGKMVPADEWSTPIRAFLEEHAPEWFIFGLDDMLPCFNVDRKAFEVMTDLIGPDVGRIGLVWSKRYQHPRNVVMLRPDADYRATTQYSIWNKQWLLDIMTPGMSPWKFEKPGPRGDSAKVFMPGNIQPVHFAHGLASGVCKHGPDHCICCNRKVDSQTLQVIRRFA